MSRKILSVVLAFILIAGFGAFMAKADVTGSFSANITVQPIPCGAFPFTSFDTGTPAPVNCENTFTKTDFETSLNLNWTISGLTLGVNTVAGFTGIEHVLTNLKATLGALNITDQFFFAVPYGTDIMTIANGKNQTHSQLAWTVISPNLLFVKKRVTASISIAGITLTNLAELADVTFPSATGYMIMPIPCAEIVTAFGPDYFQYQGKCPWLPAQSNYPDGYTAASQTFRFGDTITVEGQTVSGITVRNITGIGMDPQIYELFKKISFAGAVCNNKNLGFAVEKIQVEGIPLGPVTWDQYAEFRFNANDTPCLGVYSGSTLPWMWWMIPGSISPFVAETDLSFSTPIGNVLAIFSTTDITQAAFNYALLTLSSGGVTVQQQFTSTLAPLSTRGTLATTLNPDSNPASLKVRATICQSTGVGLFFGGCTGNTGLQRVDTTLSVKRSGLTVSVFTRMSGGPPVSLYALRFSASATAGAVNLGADVTVLPTPWTGVFKVGINF